MRTLPAAALALLVSLASSPAEPTAANDGGWHKLVDGDLSQWTNPYTYGEAKLVDGEVHLSADKKFFLVTKETYANFIFEGEIHLPEGQANSGIMFRCHVQPNKVFGYQAECDGSDRKWSAGLYDEGRRQWLWPSKTGPDAKTSQAFFKEPKIANALDRNGWNRYRITCIGAKIKIELNDTVITEYEDDMDASGPFGIQHHGEKGQTYRFRNLRVKKLP